MSTHIWQSLKEATKVAWKYNYVFVFVEGGLFAGQAEVPGSAGGSKPYLGSHFIVTWECQKM